MQRVYKYVLSPDGSSVDMPVGAEILTAREQDEQICVWAKVDADFTLTEKRKFLVAGTGHDLPEDPNWHYIGTAMLERGRLVMHVFHNRF